MLFSAGTQQLTTLNYDISFTIYKIFKNIEEITELIENT